MDMFERVAHTLVFPACAHQGSARLLVENGRFFRLIVHPPAKRQAIFKRALRCFPITLQSRNLAQYAINGHAIIHEAVQFLNALTIGSSLLSNPQVEETFSEHRNIEMTAIPHRLRQYSLLRRENGHTAPSRLDTILCFWLQRDLPGTIAPPGANPPCETQAPPAP